MMNVKRRNLEKLRHVIRFETIRVVKRIFKINPKNIRKADMSRLR
jgi:hypothetical protein